MSRLLLIAAVIVYLGRLLAPWLPRLTRITRGPLLAWVGLTLHGIGLLVVIALEGPQSTPHLVLVGL
ncbi:MAG: hypothetical protein ACI8RZ_003381, partial [Myxococcota bacterium]